LPELLCGSAKSKYWDPDQATPFALPGISIDLVKGSLRQTGEEREGSISPSLSGAASLAELIEELTEEFVIQNE
jgi:hypothetical protein